MLVPFAIDPNALHIAQGDDAKRLAGHSRVLDIWRQVGVLVHGGERFDESELKDAVERLPQPIKTLWQKALRYQRVTPAGAGWQSFVVPAVPIRLFETGWLFPGRMCRRRPRRMVPDSARRSIRGGRWADPRCASSLWPTVPPSSSPLSLRLLARSKSARRQQPYGGPVSIRPRLFVVRVSC